MLQLKTLRAATKTWCSQINKYFKKKFNALSGISKYTTYDCFVKTKCMRFKTHIRSDQIRSVAQLCPTLCNLMNAARQASLSITNSRVHPDSRPSSQWCHPAISSSVVPLSSCPKSLPASESFPMSQLFICGGQSTGVSALASVLPKKSQGWSPSQWTGWISLQSKGLSRVFSNTTVQRHQFFGAQPSSQSNSHIHTWPQEKPQPWLDGRLLAK